MTGHIFNIQKFCLHDGPGIRTAVFFKGCNLRCKWCANPESQGQSVQITWDSRKCTGCGRCEAGCPNGAKHPLDTACVGCGVCLPQCPAGAIGKEGRRVTAEEVAAEVMKDKAFYDHSGGGVTLSGGEVLLQWDFAEELAKMLQNQGVHVAVETAGAVPERVFSAMLETVDYVLMDLKHWDSAAHKVGTGVENGQILKNLQLLQNSGVPFLIRIPVIPGFNDDLKAAEGFGKILREMQIPRVELLPFHQLGQHKYSLLNMPYEYGAVGQLDRAELAGYRAVLESCGIEVKL